MALLARPRLILSVWFLAGALAFAQVQDLGAPANRYALAEFISDDGRVISGDMHAQGGPVGVQRIVRFSDVGDVFLGDTINGQTVDLVGMSRHGRFVVGNLGHLHATRWDEQGTALDLGVLAGPTSRARGMSADGSTVVGLAVAGGGSNPFYHAFRWTEATGMVDIHPPFATTTSTAYAASADGSVVVGVCQVANPGSHDVTTGMLWSQATGSIKLAPAADLAQIWATSVSRDGTVATGRYVAEGEIRAFPFVWTAATGLTVLDGVPAGNAVASIVTDDGSMLYGYSEDTGFTWNASTGYRFFDGPNAFKPTAASSDGSVLLGSLPHQNNDYAVWSEMDGLQGIYEPPGTHVFARDISADGSVITGILNRGSNNLRPVIWRRDGTIGQPWECAPVAANSVSPGGATMTLSGSNATADATLTLAASDLPPGVFGFFLSADTEATLIQPGGSQGNLCLGSSVGRYIQPSQILNSGAGGAFSLTVDPNLFPSPAGPVAPMFGEMRYFQAWYRDANPLPTSNFTSAVRVRIY